MSISDNVKERSAAAGNPMTDRWDLTRLAEDASIEVRSWVLRNPKCPEWILRERAEKDSEKSLREFAKYRISMIDYSSNAE